LQGFVYLFNAGSKFVNNGEPFIISLTRENRVNSRNQLPLLTPVLTDSHRFLLAHTSC